MLRKQCIPFYSDNNSSNLPFYLSKDTRGNDVIYINDQNMIYTNQKGLEINDQLNLYEKCLNQGICYYYKIDKELAIIKKQINKDIHWYLLNGTDQIGIYNTKYDNLEDIKIYFNDKYFCLTSMEYGECMPSIVAGYDITQKKFLDCSDYKTENSLYKSLVEVRRCRFDCICSILSGKLLLEDEERLFNFLSFILNQQVNHENLRESLSISRDYILHKYPDLSQINVYFDKSEIEKQSENFDVGHYYFNRMSKKLEELKYLNNKVYVKIKF